VFTRESQLSLGDVDAGDRVPLGQPPGHRDPSAAAELEHPRPRLQTLQQRVEHPLARLADGRPPSEVALGHRVVAGLHDRGARI
jgi:hypothetical protein